MYYNFFVVYNLFSISFRCPHLQLPKGTRKRDGSYQLWSPLSSFEELPFPETSSSSSWVHSIYSQHGISVKCLLWNSLWVTRLSVKCTGAHMSGILGKVLFSISPSHSSHFSISTHDHGPKQGRICVLGTMSDKLSKFCAQKVWFCLLKS